MKKPHVLYMPHRLPFPPDKGERIRAFHQIVELSKHFDITLACPLMNRLEADFATGLDSYLYGMVGSLAGGWPYALGHLLEGEAMTQGFFYSRKLYSQLYRYLQDHPIDLVIGYSSVMFPYLGHVVMHQRARQRRIAAVIDMVDVDSAKYRQYANSAGWFKRRIYRHEAKCLQRMECEAIEFCDASFVITEQERRLIPSALRSQVSVAGNGVDSEFYDSQAEYKDMGLPEDSLVFVGQMDYHPNVEGVIWFVNYVFPALRRRYPDLLFFIVGRNPSPKVQELDKIEGVIVTGEVADTRGFLQGAKLAICPLQMARGVQNKVLEALSMGRPCVVSPSSREGIDAEVGRHLLQADTPHEWIETISALFEDAPQRAALGRAGRELIDEKYSWAAQQKLFVECCQYLAERGGKIV